MWIFGVSYLEKILQNRAISESQIQKYFCVDEYQLVTTIGWQIAQNMTLNGDKQFNSKVSMTYSYVSGIYRPATVLVVWVMKEIVARALRSEN